MIDDSEENSHGEQQPHQLQFEPPGNQNNAEERFFISFEQLILVAAFVYHLSFIIGDLAYSSRDTQCMTAIAKAVTFTLQTWLRIDAFTRITHIGFYLLATILSCVFRRLQSKIIVSIAVFSTMYGIFFFAWALAGSILFWGHINPMGICKNDEKFYMYALLIISHMTVCAFYLWPK